MTPSTASEEIATRLQELRAERMTARLRARELDAQVTALERALQVLNPDEEPHPAPNPVPERNGAEPESEGEPLPSQLAHETVNWEKMVEILWALHREANRLPFVGFGHFQKSRVPGVIGMPYANMEFTHSLLMELIDDGYVEVYHVENPHKPDFPTAAIRLTDEGIQEMNHPGGEDSEMNASD